MMKRSERSVSRSAMTCALSASGNTLGQSLKTRLVVMHGDDRPEARDPDRGERVSARDLVTEMTKAV